MEKLYVGQKVLVNLPEFVKNSQFVSEIVGMDDCNDDETTLYLVLNNAGWDLSEIYAKHFEIDEKYIGQKVWWVTIASIKVIKG